MVNYKGHLFAFRVPFIPAVTSLRAQINQDEHPLAVAIALTFYSSVACSSLLSLSLSVQYQARHTVLSSSNFVLAGSRRPSALYEAEFNDRSSNLR